MNIASNQKFAQIKRLVRTMADDPSQRLPLSRKALDLLREIPKNGQETAVMEGAKNIRWGLRELYADPARRNDAGRLAEEVNGFIKSRKIPGSIH